eukprot:SAG31_NODE_270_length_18732_cov_9.342618_15_plen_550_part_00
MRICSVSRTPDRLRCLVYCSHVLVLIRVELLGFFGATISPDCDLADSRMNFVAYAGVSSHTQTQWRRWCVQTFRSSLDHVLYFEASGRLHVVCLHRLQITAEGRTRAEVSDGPPAECTADIAGSIYFDSASGEFFGCDSESTWGTFCSVHACSIVKEFCVSDSSRTLAGPLGASPGHVLCEAGWGGDGCTADVVAPTVACESGIVSVQVLGEHGTHLVTAADIPLPVIVNSGPIFGGNITVELTPQVVGSGATVWTQFESSGSFNWETATSIENALAIPVNIAAAVAVEDIADDATTYVVYRVTDSFGNSRACDVRIHVADFDECTDGTHTCDETALCENLFDERGVSGEGHVVTGTYACACPEGFEGDGYSECIADVTREELLAQVAIQSCSWGRGGQGGSLVGDACLSQIAADNLVVFQDREYTLDLENGAELIGMLHISTFCWGNNDLTFILPATVWTQWVVYVCKDPYSGAPDYSSFEADMEDTGFTLAGAGHSPRFNYDGSAGPIPCYQRIYEVLDDPITVELFESGHGNNMYAHAAVFVDVRA